MLQAPRLVAARIVAIRHATALVSVLWLEYGAHDYRFRPGQWIDLCVTVAGQREVGGYSITSTHRETGRIRIAVKHSDHHPVTRWLTHRARVGDAVEISEGQGRFHYAPEHGRRLVLLGAGIGVTPLIGILREVYECYPEVGATLVYAARDEADLLFRAELDAMAAARTNIRCLYFTGGAAKPSERNGPPAVFGRLEAAGLIDARTTYYFCGPRGFVDEVAAGLAARGITEDRLVYERWW